MRCKGHCSPVFPDGGDGGRVPSGFCTSAAPCSTWKAERKQSALIALGLHIAPLLLAPRVTSRFLIQPCRCKTESFFPTYNFFFLLQISSHALTSCSVSATIEMPFIWILCWAVQNSYPLFYYSISQGKITCVVIPPCLSSWDQVCL